MCEKYNIPFCMLLFIKKFDWYSIWQYHHTQLLYHYLEFPCQFINFYSTCKNITFFACTIFYWIFTFAVAYVVVPFLLWIPFFTIKFTSTFTWSLFYKCFQIIYSFEILNKFISAPLFGIHILLDRSSSSLHVLSNSS